MDGRLSTLSVFIARGKKSYSDASPFTVRAPFVNHRIFLGHWQKKKKKSVLKTGSLVFFWCIFQYNNYIPPNVNILGLLLPLLQSTQIH